MRRSFRLLRALLSIKLSTVTWISIVLVFVALWNLPPLPGNYDRLESRLSEGDFRKADLITRDIISEIASQENAMVRSIHGLFEPVYFQSDLDRVSCKDLMRIDELWRKYSNGKFGFYSQKQIWDRWYTVKIEIELEIGRDSRRQKFLALAHQVGWMRKNQQVFFADKFYKSLNFALTAPVGHLPSWVWTAEESKPIRNEEYKYETLFQKIQLCSPRSTVPETEKLVQNSSLTSFDRPFALLNAP
jgi:GUN4-like